MDAYEPMKVLGEGSFGKVYLMKHRTTRELVCTKVIKLKNLPKKEQIACRNEVEVLRRMRHPNIVAYYDSFLYKNCLCIIMEYCDAGDLAGRVNKARGRLFPESKILTWFVQVALGIHYMHSNHTLHRDIKTQNIFILSSGRVVLGDLGISKVMEGTTDFASTCIGTPYYMSPEIFQNKPYNNKSDVWALGCVLYELTTLKHAFDANSINGLAYKIIKGRYPAPDSRYSRHLRGLIKDMLGTNPKVRPDIEQVLRKTFVKNRVAEFTADLTLEGLGAGQSTSLASLRKQLDDLGMPEALNANAGLPREGGGSNGGAAVDYPQRSGSPGRSSGGGKGGLADEPGHGGRRHSDSGRGEAGAADSSWQRQRRQLEAEEERRLAAETALQRLHDQGQSRHGSKGSVSSSGGGGRHTPGSGGGARSGDGTNDWRDGVGSAAVEDASGGRSVGGSGGRTPGTNSPSPVASPVASPASSRSPSPTAATAAAAAGGSSAGNGTPTKRRNSVLRKLMELGGRGRSGSIGGNNAAAAAVAAAAAGGGSPPRGESRERESNRGLGGILSRHSSRASIAPEEGAAEAAAVAGSVAAPAAAEKPRGVYYSARRGSRSPSSPGSGVWEPLQPPPLPPMGGGGGASPPPPPLGPPPLGVANRQRGRAPSSGMMPVQSEPVIYQAGSGVQATLPSLHARHASHAGAGALPEVRERRGSVSPSHRAGISSRDEVIGMDSSGGACVGLEIDSPAAAALPKGSPRGALSVPRRSSLCSLESLPPQRASSSAAAAGAGGGQQPPLPQSPPPPLQRLPGERRASVSLSPLRTGSGIGSGICNGSSMSGGGTSGGNSAPDEATALWRGRRASAAISSPERVAVGRDGVPLAGGGPNVSSRSPSPRMFSAPSAESLASASGYDREVSEYLDAQARAHTRDGDDEIHRREAMLREQLRLAELRCQELRQTLQQQQQQQQGGGPEKRRGNGRRSPTLGLEQDQGDDMDASAAATPDRSRSSGSHSSSHNGSQNGNNLTLGHVRLSVNTGRVPAEDSGYGYGLSLAESLAEAGDDGPDTLSSDGDVDEGGLGYDSSEERSPYGPSHLGTIEDPATPVGRLVDRVNFLRQRCIEGLGKDRFETAFSLLKALADDGSAMVMYGGRAYSGTDDDQVQELLESVIGRDKLQYWNLMDQLLLMGA